MDASYEKNLVSFFTEMAKFQTRLVKGMENLMELEDVETATTPKELVWKQDKVQLFHYKPEKLTCPEPVLVIYALVISFLLVFKL